MEHKGIVPEKDSADREQADAALRESEQFRHLIFEASPIPVVIMDAETLRYIDCNPAAVKVGGYTSKEDMLRMTPTAHGDLPQYDGTPSSKKGLYYIEQAKAQGSVEFEWRHQRPNGEIWDALVHLMSFRSGERNLMQFTLQDITARKRVENALRASEQKFRLLFENMIAGFALHEMIYDESGKPIDYRFLEANPAFERITGIKVQDLIGRTVREALPNTEQYWIDTYGKVAQSGEPLSYQNFAQDIGRYFDVWAYSPAKGQFAVVFVDITDRKKAEDSLQLFRDLVAHSSDAIGMSTPEGKHYYQNEAFDRLFGDIGENPPATLYVDQAIGETVFHTIMAGENWQGEVKMHTADGAILDILLRAFAIKAPDGKLLAVVGLHTDITARKRAEEDIARLNTELEERVQQRTAELAEANQQLRETLSTLQHAQKHLVRNEKLVSLGALVAGVAHELNTPLGNSYTLSTTLQEIGRDFLATFEKGELKRSTLKHYVDLVNEAADRISRNLYRANEMIAHFKQVTADQTSAQRRRFELKQNIEEVVSILQPQFKRTTHQIILGIAPDLMLESYPGPLDQIITNLVINAQFHGFDGRENGIIHIHAEALDRQRVRISISDNGCGIPPENMPRIFDPFFTTRLGSGGSGLGLHIVYSIATRVLGGSIDVSSNSEGTVFTLDIPLIAPMLDKKDAEI